MITAISYLIWGAEEIEKEQLESQDIPCEMPDPENEWILVGPLDDVKTQDEEELGIASTGDTRLDMHKSGESASTKLALRSSTNSYHAVAGRLQKLEIQRRVFGHCHRMCKQNQCKLTNKVHARHQGPQASKKYGRMNGKHSGMVGKRAC